MRDEPRKLWRPRWRYALVAAALLLAGMSESGAIIAARSTVQIINIGNADLTYEIRPTGGAWTQHKIVKGGTASFDCTDCSGFELRIATGDKAATTRSLQSGQTYQIFWNATEKAWDVGVAQRR